MTNITGVVAIKSFNASMEAPLNAEDLLVVSIWSSLLTYGFIMNIITVAGIIRNRHMRQSTSYWLIISLALCDILMIVVSLAHLMPATIFHNDFVPVNDWRNIFALFVYNVFWYTGVIQLGGMAVNRFVSIVLPVKYRLMFSRQNTAIILVILWALGIAASVPALFPCCYTVYDHNIWLTSYIDVDSLYYIVDLSLNTISLSIMIFCYAAILWKVRKSQLSTRRHRTTNNVNNSSLIRNVSQRGQPNSREMKLFIQFFVVSVVFLVTFLSWQWLLRLPDASKWIYFTTTTFFFVNNAVNPTVYLIYNSGLRREVRLMFCWWRKEKQPQQTPSSDGQTNQPDAITTVPTSRADSERVALAP